MNLTLMVRGFTQYLVSALLSLAPMMLALDFLINEVKLPIQKEALAIGLEAIVFSLVIAGLNKIGESQPWVNKFLSWGRSASGPAYVKPGETTAAITVTETGTSTFTESGAGQPAPATFEENPTPPPPSNI